MRDILFRGKRVDNGEWVESNCFYQCNGKVKLWDEPNRDGYVEVEKETLGQFTGLTDVNGKKIFEGDIVRGKNFLGLRREGVVFYDEIDGIYKIKPTTKSNYRESNENELLYPTDGYIEIIGNIHDNPELLGE